MRKYSKEVKSKNEKIETIRYCICDKVTKSKKIYHFDGSNNLINIEVFE